MIGAGQPQDTGADNNYLVCHESSRFKVQSSKFKVMQGAFHALIMVQSTRRIPISELQVKGTPVRIFSLF
jgi:hypothetical protein